MRIKMLSALAIFSMAALSPTFAAEESTPTPTPVQSVDRKLDKKDSKLDKKDSKIDKKDPKAEQRYEVDRRGRDGNNRRPEDTKNDEKWNRSVNSGNNPGHAEDKRDGRWRNDDDRRRYDSTNGTNTGGVIGGRDGKYPDRGGDYERGRRDNYIQLKGDAIKGDKNLLGTLQRAGQFSMFLKAIDKGDMKEKFNKNTYTVFAPTDDAFSRIPQDKLDALFANRDAIRDVVRRHIVEKKMDAAALSAQSSVISLEKQSLPIESKDATITRVGRATVLQTNVPSTNGIIHVVNGFFVQEADYIREVKSNLTDSESKSSKETSSSNDEEVKKTGVANILSGIFGSGKKVESTTPADSTSK